MVTGDGASQNNSAHSSLLKPDLGQELGVEEEEVIPDTRRFRLQPEQSQQCKSMFETKLYNFSINVNSISAVVWTNDSLVFFFIFGKWPLKFWGVIWQKDSLVLIQPWHQGVFCLDHPNTKESFGQIIPL